jgi:hypothetical protein
MISVPVLGDESGRLLPERTGKPEIGIPAHPTGFPLISKVISAFHGQVFSLASLKPTAAFNACHPPVPVV